MSEPALQTSLPLDAAVPAPAAEVVEARPPLRVVLGPRPQGHRRCRRSRPAWRSRRTTLTRRSGSSASSGSATSSRRSSSAAASPTPEQARAFLEPSEEHPTGRVRRYRRRAVELITRHIRRAAGSPCTATTTSTACARRRCWSGRCGRSAATSTGSFRPGSTTATGCRPTPSRRLAARGTGLLITVDCGITAVDEVGRRERPRARRRDHRPPPAARGRPLPDCPIVHPAVCGYPCARAVRHGRRVQARPGARGRRPPTTTSSWSRSRRSPT